MTDGGLPGQETMPGKPRIIFDDYLESIGMNQEEYVVYLFQQKCIRKAVREDRRRGIEPTSAEI